MEKEPNLNQSGSENHTEWDSLNNEKFKNERYERMELGNELYERIQNNAKIKKTFAIVALAAAIGAGIFTLGAHTYKSRTVEHEVRNTWEAEDFGLTEDDLDQFEHAENRADHDYVDGKGHLLKDHPMPDHVPSSSTLSPSPTQSTSADSLSSNTSKPPKPPVPVPPDHDYVDGKGHLLKDHPMPDHVPSSSTLSPSPTQSTSADSLSSNTSKPPKPPVPVPPPNVDQGIPTPPE